MRRNAKGCSSNRTAPSHGATSKSIPSTSTLSRGIAARTFSSRPPELDDYEMNLSAEVGAITPGAVVSPWKGFEHVRGWGVFGAPVSSGHVLALRVFPQSDFGAYRTLWHRNNVGDWTIYYDGPSAATSCPRYYSAATVAVVPATIGLTWSGPSTLIVKMSEPAFIWSMKISRSPAFSFMSAITSLLPEAAWRSHTLHRMMERAAKRLLGLGSIRMSGPTPNGQYGVLTPRRMYPIASSHATFDGVDLGHTIRSDDQPMIGGTPLSSRAVFAIG